MIDLHTHTTASDGQYTPSQLIEKAKNAGLKVIAITDHDTVAGLEEGQKKADEVGIKFVPGIEINIQWPTGEFHLLGLGLNHISPEMKDIIKDLQEERKTRNQIIIDKMNENGIHVTMDEMLEIYKTSSIGRPHFADYLVSHKIVKNRQAAFDKYLANGRPFYYPHHGADLDMAITAIAECGGIPVIAHPLSLYVSWGKIEPVLTDIKERGVKGLEAWHPGARIVECKRLEEMGRRLGFFITAGSDFHGEAIRANRKIGYTSGMTKIDDKFWDEELSKHVIISNFKS